MQNCGESISTVSGGVVGALGHPEVLVTTYSGRIFGLTTRPPSLIEAGQDEGVIAKLKIEIEELEQKINQLRETSDLSADTLAPPILSVNHR